MEFLSVLKKVGFFFVDHWRAFAIVFGVILLAVVFNKVCNRPPKLNEKQIEKGEVAVKQRNDEHLKDVLAESDTASENIDTTIKQAEENTQKAKKNYDGWTTDELAAEYERRKNQ